MVQIQAFEKIASFLMNPLILIGFALFLIFSIYQMMIKSGLISPISEDTGNILLKKILDHGFIIILITIVLGFSLQWNKLKKENIDRIIKNYSITPGEYNTIINQIEVQEGFLKALSLNKKEERLRVSTKLNMLKEKKNKTEEDIIRLTERFTSIKINKKKLKLAKVKFEKGEIIEADKILNEEEINKNQNLLLEKKERDSKGLRNNSNEFLIKALITAAMHNNKKWFEETIQLFDKSLVSDRNKENIYEYAFFLQEHNKLNKALNLYKELLVILEKKLPVHEPDIAKTLNSLGKLYRNKNDYDSALISYNKALEIYERLAEINPKKYESDVADTYNNLGILFFYKIDYDSALIFYKKSLEVRERLAKTNPEKYESDVAMTYNSLGVSYRNKNDYDLALISYNKALEIYERLAKINPEKYEPKVADTHNNLGILFFDKTYHDSALVSYNRALEIYERLAVTDPAAYEPYVAKVYNNLGVLYINKSDHNLALSSYNKVLEIYERLARIDPAAYEPYVAMTLNNLGNFYSDKNYYNLALTSYKRALKIYERLAKIDPAAYEPYVAMTFNNLGDLYSHENYHDLALISYNKAIEIYERLNERNLGIYELELVRVYINFSILELNNNNIESGSEKLRKAKEISEKNTYYPFDKFLNIINILSPTSK